MSGMVPSTDAFNDLVDDCVGWNVGPWQRGIHAILAHVGVPAFAGARVLEVGAGRKSTLAPVFAALGASAVASFWGSDPSALVLSITDKYKLALPVRVEQLDILHPHDMGEFNFIVAKSVLGGLALHDNFEALAIALSNMRRILKPGGALLLLENGYGTNIHAMLRRFLGAGRNGWHYFSYDEFIHYVLKGDDQFFDTFGLFSFADFRLRAVNRTAFALDEKVNRLINRRNRLIYTAVTRTSA